MKELIEKYKELKGNRRTVGLAKLLFWLLFFIIIMVIYYMPASNRKTYEPVTNNDNNESNTTEEDIINNYYFKYVINGDEYKGTYYDGFIELIGTKCSFYVTDIRVLTDKEECILPDYDYIDINYLNKIIKNLELDSKTSYKDGKVEYKYISDQIVITYAVNSDKTVDATILNTDNEIIVNYYDFNEVKISFDDNKYIYELKEVQNEYKN